MHMIEIGNVTVVDFGAGNLLSVKAALEHIGSNVVITSDKNEILKAERLILPGVGAFPNAMKAISDIGIKKTLKDYALSGRPFLGICLGMQLFMDYSEEFQETEGLGIIPGKVELIQLPHENVRRIKVPHIGWNELIRNIASEELGSSILFHVNEEESVYFVHSFIANPKRESDVIARTNYAGNIFCSAIKHSNVTGVQFHPEKSGTPGLEILKRFVQS